MRYRLNPICRCLLVLVALLAIDARGAGQIPADVRTKPAGTILSETKRDLGNGYLEIQRAEMNPPGHWEGIGHFDFVYFRDEKLCQCDAGEVPISPCGEFALYVGRGGQLTLFSAATKARKRVTERYEGTPINAEWELSRHRVSVTMEKYVNGRGTKSTLVVHL